MRRRILAIALALAALFALSSCGVPSPEPENPPESLPELSEETGDMGEAEDREETEETEDTEETETPTAEMLLETMTLREKLCQMLLVEPEALAGESGIGEYPVGGVVLFKRHLTTGEETKELIRGFQEASSLGLFIAVDEEGGVVNRLMSTLGTTPVGSMYGYQDEGAATARANALTIGRDIAAYGFNLNFAPVADVWSNPENTVIGERAYSDDFEKAAPLVAAAVEGFHEAGVICTLKHFPGHGDTAEDSHTGAAFVTKTREELVQAEWLPFEAGIRAGADMVMVGHLTVPDIDEEIATVSPVIVTEILRGELSFEGVVITDSLAMGAATEAMDAGELAVRAVEAGVDILLMPENVETTLEALAAAVESGRISVERIDESVTRILTLKIQYGIIS